MESTFEALTHYWPTLVATAFAMVVTGLHHHRSGPGPRHTRLTRRGNQWPPDLIALPLLIWGLQADLSALRLICGCGLGLDTEQHLRDTWAAFLAAVLALCLVAGSLTAFWVWMVYRRRRPIAPALFWPSSLCAALAALIAWLAGLAISTPGALDFTTP